jgi:hypothetical protein
VAVHTTGADSHGDEQKANLDLLIDQMQEEFNLYERRHLAVETQATAVTAASLVIAALLVTNRGDVVGIGTQIGSCVGTAIEIGVALAIGGLLWTIALASLARFGSWLTPKWRGGPSGQRHLDVQRAVEKLKACGEYTPPLRVRRLAVEHWKTRATSTRELGKWKRTRLNRGLWGLALTAVLFLVVAALLPF